VSDDNLFDDGVIERIADELREAERPSADFDARVMASVRGIARARRRERHGLWNRVTQPRTITVRPWRAGLAAAALLLCATLVGWGAHAFARMEAAAPATLASSGSQRIQFVLVAPNAKKVAVAGDFNGWDAQHPAYQAVHRGGGVWSVTARVPVGHHRYSFVVDDSLWVADPTAPRVIDDDFGTTNSAIVVEPEIR